MLAVALSSLFSIKVTRMTTGKKSFTTKLGGLLASAAVRTWMNSLDIQGILYDPTVDPVRDDFHGPVIVAFWHECLLAPFFLRGRTNSAILTSRHRDAEWLSEAARHLGFVTVRGSTNRGGAKALLELIRSQGTCNVGIACDGPRGPRRKLAQGPVYLSSKLQIPLITYAVGFDRPWRMPTWDQFAIPRPYSRARILVSPRLQIPANLDRAGLEHNRQRVERLLQGLTKDAEVWAASGRRMQGQQPIHARPASAKHHGRIGTASVSLRNNRLYEAKSKAA